MPSSGSLPGPIVGIGEVLWDLLPSGARAGGAPFNFAFHCHQLGHPAVIVSRVGDDQLGHALRAEARRFGMSDQFIQVDAEHPTGTVQVEVDAAGQPSYTIAANSAWDFLDFGQWPNDLERLAASARAVCFGTLAQRSQESRRTILRFVQSCRADAVKVLDLNLRPPFVDEQIIDASIAMADWLKMNDAEAELLEERWKSRAFPRLMCITHGEKGCEVLSAGRKIEIPGNPVHVVDTVGAGDAFTAGLLTQTLEGKPLEQAARFANALAALVAGRPGGTPAIDRAEVEGLC